MKTFTHLFFILLFSISFAQDDHSLNNEVEADSLDYDIEAYSKFIDSLNATYTYQYGTIEIHEGLATLVVPEGFKYLDPQQSAEVLTEVWGNPPSETLGLLFPEAMNPYDDEFTYAVEITYSEEGYIDDEDAVDLDYDELLSEMKEDVMASNSYREAEGYESLELVGWASPPFYDEDDKKLHWAKEIKFEGYDINTLNYEIRVLGRKGYLSLTAIGEIGMLEKFNEDREEVLASIDFNNGYRYSDFNPDIDEVAAYGIGGLIAGKVLAKAGFFAIILKFWKFIAIGAVALFAGFKRRLFGSKESDA